MDRNAYLSGFEGLAVAPYREAIGSVMYLMTGTRPDLAFAIGQLARNVEQPADGHWKALKRVFRYVIRTIDVGLTFQKASGLPTPKRYVDADWAGEADTRTSTSGCMVLISGARIS